MKVIIWFFRWIYYLLYHQFAWTYDYVAALVSLGRWNSWVHQALPFLKSEHVLEIGFGPGHLLFSAKLNQINIVGIDESKQMVQRAYAKISSLCPSPPLIRGNASSLPFPKKHFDQVISTFPSEYINNKNTISEIYRVLTPGGQLIILPFAWLTGKLWYEKLINHLVNFSIVVHSWEEKYCSGFKQLGFDLSVEQVNDDKSMLMFIIATKPKIEEYDQIEALVC